MFHNIFQQNGFYGKVMVFINLISPYSIWMEKVESQQCLVAFVRVLKVARWLPLQTANNQTTKCYLLSVIVIQKWMETRADRSCDEKTVFNAFCIHISYKPHSSTIHMPFGRALKNKFNHRKKNVACCY